MSVDEDGMYPAKIGRVSLKGFSTAELVAELNRRGGCPVNCPTIDETSTAPVCLPVIPTAPLVNELCSRDGVADITLNRNDSCSSRRCYGPGKILWVPDIIVVRGDE